jgi:hypothetical protein
MAQHGVADGARGVVEIDVDAARARVRERGLQIARLVVDGGVVAELVAAQRRLGRAARDADSAATGELRDLADRRAHRARRGRDDDRVAGTRRTDVEEREVCGHAVQAQNAERARERQVRLPDLARDLAAVAHRVLLPPEHAHDPVAGRVAGVARSDHLAAGERTHHLADAHRRRVVRDGAHPAAHRGVDREEVVPDQEFAVPEIGHRRDGELEMRRLRDAVRAGLQANLAIACWRHAGTLDVRFEQS